MKRRQTAASLPEDLLLEILVRVKDVPTLFRCATTCKRWCHLVLDPSFLGCRWPDQDCSSSLVGFFVWEWHKDHGHDVLVTSCFVPTPRSPLGPGHRTLSSFTTAAPDDLFDGAVSLASRHGLLLVRLEAHDIYGRRDGKTLQLAVCNLLVGTCHVLPPLKFVSPIEDIDDYEYNAYALLTGADCRSISDDPSVFKVVIITLDYDDCMYSLHVFSSDEARWSVRTNCFGDTMKDWGFFGHAVIRRGTAHWLYLSCINPWFHLIVLNTETGRISRIELHSINEYFLTGSVFLTLAANGKLLLMQHKESQLEIWGQQEDQQNLDATYSEWLRIRKIEQKELGDEIQGRELYFFGDRCGTLLIHDNKHMYITNLQTRRMEEVSNWPCKSSKNPRNFVPLEMDWPAIFIS